MNIDRIVKKFQESHPDEDTTMLYLAYDFAAEAHAGQLRKTGEPYIQHPLHTAFLLAEIKADLPTIVAGLIHDVPEDTDRTFEDVQNNFGEEIANLIPAITQALKKYLSGVRL